MTGAALLNHERRGGGEPLLLIHGVGGSWRNFTPMISALAAHHDLIAIDLPGFGGSRPLPAGVEPTPARIAAEVAAFLDRIGIDRPFVCGHSLGGWIALELAAMDRARAVVALAPAGLWRPGFESAFTTEPLRLFAKLHRREAGLRRLARTPGGRTLLLSSNSARPREIPAADAARIVGDAAAAPGFEATLTGMRGSRFGRAADVDVPVTFVWGSGERILLARRARVRQHDLFPDAETVELGRCGHLIAYDRPDAATNVILARFAGAAAR